MIPAYPVSRRKVGQASLPLGALEASFDAMGRHGHARRFLQRNGGIFRQIIIMSLMWESAGRCGRGDFRSGTWAGGSPVAAASIIFPTSTAREMLKKSSDTWLVPPDCIIIRPRTRVRIERAAGAHTSVGK